MIELQLKKPILDVEGQYTGKGVKFNPSQAVAMLARAYDNTITTKIVTRSGPIYDGELEYFILDPLVQIATNYLKGSKSSRRSELVTRSLASRSIAYSVIDQIIKVYEIREVSKYLTNDMLKSSPIYTLILGLGDVQRAIEEEEEQDTTKQEERKDQKKQEMPSALKAIMRYIKGEAKQAGKDNSLASVQSLMEGADNEQSVATALMTAACFGEGAIDSLVTGLEDTVAGIYREFVSHAKRGKGMAQTSRGRARVIQRITLVRAAVDEMFKAAQASDDPLIDGTAAMALGSALLSYLRMAENPDAYFPKQELQFNVIAWAGGLKQEAAELKEFWMYHALAPTSFTIQLAHRLWTEEISWLGFMGEEFEIVKQARSALERAKERYDVIESPFYTDLADKIIRDILTRTGATKILPTHFLKSEGFDAAFQKTLDAVRDSKVEWVYDGSNDVQAPTRMYEIPCQDKTQTSERAAIQAQSIVNAYDLVVRAAQLIAVESDDPQPIRPLVQLEVNDLIWPEVKPVSPGEKLTFTEPEPTSAALPEWSGEPWPQKFDARDTFMPKWRMAEYLYKTIRPLRALWKGLSDDRALLMWSVQDVPEVMGDAISRPWGTQPVPACYTYQRNRTIRPYTMQEYLMGMEGAIDGVPWPDYLHHAAEIIVTYGLDDPTSQAIIDYLAPVMAVNTSERRAQGGDYVLPRLKTLYGVPTAVFFSKQGAVPTTDEDVRRKSDTERSRYHFERISKEEAGATKEVVVGFALHKLYPAPKPVTILTQTLASGLSVFAPLTTVAVDKYFEKVSEADLKAATGDDLLDRIIDAWTEQDAISKQWLPAGGFAPFKLWMPGTYFRVFYRIRADKEKDQEDIMYATAAEVKWRVSEVTGALQIRGFVKDPVCLLDNADRTAALNAIDPVPDQLHLQKPENVAEGTQAPGEQKGPDPATLAAQDKEQKNATGAATAKTWLPVEAEVAGKPEVVDQLPYEAKDRVQDENGKPLTGAPEAEEFVWVVVEVDGASILKKVKKDEVPEGARLASEDEIANWLKDHGNESK